jgi:hypothetical protein
LPRASASDIADPRRPSAGTLALAGAPRNARSSAATGSASARRSTATSRSWATAGTRRTSPTITPATESNWSPRASATRTTRRPARRLHAVSQPEDGTRRSCRVVIIEDGRYSCSGWTRRSARLVARAALAACEEEPPSLWSQSSSRAAQLGAHAHLCHLTRPMQAGATVSARIGQVESVPTRASTSPTAKSEDVCLHPVAACERTAVVRSDS